MARATIDFGVDLGTTNSSIALLSRGEVRVFKNTDQRESTPSVVRIDRAGTIHVGQRAYGHLEVDTENTQAEFKRIMGTSQVLNFAAARRSLTPEELSAEVLKSLRADTVRAGFDCVAVALAVPANFEVVQCEATQRAARLAGLLEAPLVQEPIAAAIAYGKDAVPKDGYWLVYDLGGGTFDVAIIKRTGGHLSVVDCGGDNHLGGKEFDWLMVHKIFMPVLAENYALPSPENDTRAYRVLRAKLKKEAEAVKIILTDQNTATVYLEDCGPDKNGRPIELTHSVTRGDLEHLIQPKIAETIRLCHEVLNRARLSPSALERVILVGGPTMTPFIRDVIRTEMRAAVDISMDPFTVVARGAAIFASSQPFPRVHQVRASGKVLVSLAFTALCQQPTTLVAGRLEGEEGHSLPPDLRVRLARDDQGWQSGFIQVKEQAFVCQVSLREHQANTFRVSLFSGAGQSIPIEPGTLTITHGLSVSNPPLPRTIGVEVVTESGQGRYEPLILRGTPLPAKAAKAFRVAHVLQAGSGDQALNIHVFEGEHENPEHNRHLGTLVIEGARVRRTLPANAEIEVTLTVDMSRHATAKAYVPILDETFEGVLREKIAPLPSIDYLASALQRLEAQWDELKDTVFVSSDNVSHAQSRIEEIAQELVSARDGDPGSAEKADRLIRELQATLVSAGKSAELPRILDMLEDARAKTGKVVLEHGVAEDSEQLEGLGEDADRATSRRDPVLCEATTTRLWNLYWQVLFRQDGFWIGIFQDLAEQGSFDDPARAQSLIVEGSRLLQAHDLDRFRKVTSELWTMVPQQAQQEAAQRVSDAGIKT
jgi:molecular chaperone DnaK